MQRYDHSQVVANQMALARAPRVARRRASRRRTTRDHQLQLPLEESDIRHNRKVRGVYRDRNARHAIVYKVGKTRIFFVEMKKGRLAPRSLPDSKFFDLRQFERIEYPLERAVENFLQHDAGISEAARRALMSALKP